MVGRVRCAGAGKAHLPSSTARRVMAGARSLVPGRHPQRRFDAMETRSPRTDRGCATGNNRRQLFGPIPRAHRRAVSGLQLEVGTYLAPPPPASYGKRSVGSRKIAVGKGSVDMRDADRSAPGGDTTRQRRIDRQAGCKWLLDGSAASAVALKFRSLTLPGIENRLTASSRWWRPTPRLMFSGGIARSAKPQTRTNPNAPSNPLRLSCYRPSVTNGPVLIGRARNSSGASA